MDSSFATSRANAWAVPPAAAISAATSASLSRLRAARAMDAPPRASSSAQARPIPWDAPVTNAIRPATVLMDLRDNDALELYGGYGGNILKRITYPEVPCQRTRENRPRPTYTRFTEQTLKCWPMRWPSIPARRSL